jgi:hypothetical protein
MINCTGSLLIDITFADVSAKITSINFLHFVIFVSQSTVTFYTKRMDNASTYLRKHHQFNGIVQLINNETFSTNTHEYA